ncbi:hypothetical protein B0T20DRAFT_484331 [Sordaria brevicollis]|uniref:ABM domain-containing protein n=1 Tax=Sordaria brevicollis TaxID=83679 RepID=A0AAE0U2N5_SORBR|nr:hypothetical protein B0T20DRAFT_484331 [Sordaria brevicollis]
MPQNTPTSAPNAEQHSSGTVTGTSTIKLPASHEIPETEFCVYAHPQHASSLALVYQETTRLAASEPGVIYYCISRDLEDERVFHFFERYKGRVAFEEHNRLPVIKKLLEEDGYIERVEAVFASPLMARGGE